MCLLSSSSLQTIKTKTRPEISLSSNIQALHPCTPQCNSLPKHISFPATRQTKSSSTASYGNSLHNPVPAHTLKAIPKPLLTLGMITGNSQNYQTSNRMKWRMLSDLFMVSAGSSSSRKRSIYPHEKLRNTLCMGMKSKSDGVHPRKFKSIMKMIWLPVEASCT